MSSPSSSASSAMDCHVPLEETIDHPPQEAAVDATVAPPPFVSTPTSQSPHMGRNDVHKMPSSGVVETLVPSEPETAHRPWLKPDNHDDGDNDDDDDDDRNRKQSPDPIMSTNSGDDTSVAALDHASTNLLDEDGIPDCGGMETELVVHTRLSPMESNQHRSWQLPPLTSGEEATKRNSCSSYEGGNEQSVADAMLLSDKLDVSPQNFRIPAVDDVPNETLNVVDNEEEEDEAEEHRKWGPLLGGNSVSSVAIGEPSAAISVWSEAKMSSKSTATTSRVSSDPEGLRLDYDGHFVSDEDEKSHLSVARRSEELVSKFEHYRPEYTSTEKELDSGGEGPSTNYDPDVVMSEEAKREESDFKTSSAPPTALVADTSSGVVSEVTTPSADFALAKPDPPGLQDTPYPPSLQEDSSLLPEPALVRARANLVRTTPGAYSMAGPGAHLSSPDLADDESNHNDDDDETTQRTYELNSLSPRSLGRSSQQADYASTSTFQTRSLDPSGIISAEVEAELVDETQRDLELLRLQEINLSLQRQLEAIGSGRVSIAHAELITASPILDADVFEGENRDSSISDRSSQEEQGVLDKFFLSSSRVFWLLAGLLFLVAVTTGGLVAARRADSDVRLDLVSPSSLPTQFPTSGSPGPTTILLRSPAPTEQPSWREGPTSLTPSFEPSVFVTVDPTLDITSSLFPSLHPSDSVKPSATPSQRSNPTTTPTWKSSPSPSSFPTGGPTDRPSLRPSTRPTVQPVLAPTDRPSQRPVLPPITQPVAAPTSRPTQRPVAAPVPSPVPPPTPRPTQRPVVPPVSPPVAPTQRPTARPTPRPTARPTLAPVTLSPTAPKKCFDSTSELRVAVSLYVELPYSFTETSRTYGFPIGTWCVGNIRDFSAVFQDKVNFNEDISSWDTRRATNMKDMFGQATSFNIDLNNWDVSNVQNMEGMFFGATSFSRGVSKWNVSRVTNMLGMFNLAISFNDNLSSWDVSRVRNMGLMFSGATMFNHDISNWDVSSVTNAASMFFGATSFRRDLCQWGPKLVSNRPSVQNMFVLSRCPMKSSPDFNTAPVNPLCFACG